MNKTWQVSLLIVGALVIGSALLFLGFSFGRFGWPFNASQSSFYQMPGRSMMNLPNQEFSTDEFLGYGMMGPGMMGGYMHNGYNFNSTVVSEPLTIEEVDEAVHGFLSEFGDTNLILGEIMIFDNHAYAQIIEEDTDIGAMEVLIDPATLAVNPEHGPNMMWNLKYAHMSGVGNFDQGGMMNSGGMMGGRSGFTSGNITGDMPVSPQDAVSAAQDYLNANMPGTEADEHADPFYGYYTLHILADGEVIGMLSVNGFSGQVFLHTWHGEFIEMSEH